MENIEKTVADTILQKEQEITIGQKTYYTAPPSIATLILVSEAVSRLPQRTLDSGNILKETIAIAKDSRPLGEIAAILILGAKGIEETVSVVETQQKKYIGGLFRRNVKTTVSRKVNHKEKLTEEILLNYSPSELHALIAQLLQRMQIGDFFALTTFLTEVNLLSQTKVEEES